MELIKIRFGDFTFETNPSELKVEYSLKTKENEYIGEKSKLSLSCEKLKRVKGRGVAFGEGAIKTYEKLENLFLKSKEDMLVLPGTKPFKAMFIELSQSYPEGSECISYEFVFSEVETNKKETPSFLITEKEESLWDISYALSLDIDLLTEKNTHIENINYIKKGEKIYLC